MRRLILPVAVPLFLALLLLLAVQPSVGAPFAEDGRTSPPLDPASPAAQSHSSVAPLQQPLSPIESRDGQSMGASSEPGVDHSSSNRSAIQTCQPQPLDVYYVIDASQSMDQGYQGSDTKLDAAREAIRGANSVLEDFNNGSRAGVITFAASQYGQGIPPRYSPFLDTWTYLTTNFAEVNDSLGYFGGAGSTPTALALSYAADMMRIDNLGGNRPVLVLLSDGVPTISDERFAFADEDVQEVELLDANGNFLTIEEVRALGQHYPNHNMYAGEPLADVMDATLVTKARQPELTIHAIAIQGHSGNIFNDDVLRYVATYGDGAFAQPDNLVDMEQSLVDAIMDSACLPPVTPPPAFCPNPLPLDVFYVVDGSDVMNQVFNGTSSKFVGVKRAMVEANAALASLQNGSRAGVLTFYSSGHTYGTPPTHPTYVDLHADLNPNLAEASRALELFNHEYSQPQTPTSHGISDAASMMLTQNEGGRIPVFILLSGGVPTISDERFGFTSADVGVVDLRDGSGNFLTSEQVRLLGNYYSVNGKYAGEPLADVMDATVAARTDLAGLVIHAVALQNVAPNQFNDDVLRYAAVTTDGVFAQPDNLADLEASLRDAVAQSACLLADLPPDQTYAEKECPFCGNDERQDYVGPINSYTGNYHLEATDLALPTRGQPLLLARAYNSLAVTGTLAYTLPLGPGWTHRYATRLVLPEQPDGEAETIILQAPRGSRMRWAANADGSYTPFPGVWATLARSLTEPTVYTITAVNQEQWVFDASGRFTTHLDAQGSVTTLTYEDGQLDRVTDGTEQRWLAFDYDAQGRLDTLTDHSGRTVDYGYDAAGNLATVTDLRSTQAVPLVWEYHYTGTHLLHEVIDPSGHIIEHIEYDSEGRAIRQADGVGRTLVAVDFDTGEAGQRGVVARGAVLTDTYNSQGLLVGQGWAGDDPAAFGFDGSFNRTTVVDANGNPTQYEFTAFGQPTFITDALGLTTTLTYDGRNNLSTIVDSQGYTTTYEYDGANNLRAVTDTLGAVTRYEYDAFGQPTVITDALGQRTRYEYDALGQRTAITDALSFVTRYGYDDLGRVVTTTNALGQVTRNEWDAAGHLLAVTENFTTTPGLPSNEWNLVTRYGYDGAGRQTAITDTLGRLTLNEYDDAGRLVQVTANVSPTLGQNAASQYNLVTRYGYDAWGRQVAVTDTLGHVTRTEYDAAGRVARTVVNFQDGVYDPAQPDEDLISRTEYDAAGNPTRSWDALGRETRTAYDALNRPITVTLNFQDGQFELAQPDQDVRTVYGYDAASSPHTVTDALGRVTLTEFDPLGRPITETLNFQPGLPASADRNVRTVHSYDPLGQPLAVTNAAGYPTGYGYDVLGRVITATDALSGTTVTTYDALGRRSTITDAEGHVTRYDYDSLGRVLTVTLGYELSATPDADTNVTTAYSYDAAGNKLTETDAEGHVTRYEYDAQDRPITVTLNYTPAVGLLDDHNVRTVYEYDPLGRRIAATDALTHTTRYGLDGLGRTVVVTDALGITTTFGYDGLGNRLSVSNGEGETTRYEYDGLNRLVTVTDADDHATHYGYDAVGNRVILTDAAGVVTRYGYDALDRLTSVTENAVPTAPATVERNVLTRYSYDAVGNRVVITNALGYTTTFSYDALARLTVERDALGHTTRYGYDAIGNRTVMTDANGVVTHYAHDALARVATVDFASQPDVTFGYDVLGQRRTMTDGTGTTDYTYDEVGRLVSATDGAGQTVGWRYDAAGRRTRLLQSGATVVYSYDAANRLASVTEGSQQYLYDYDAAHRLTDLHYPNGVATTYEYNAAGWLEQLEHATTTETLAQYDYAFDAVGNRRAITETLLAPPAPAADLVFADGLETGDLSAWSSSQTDSGDLQASTSAALVGTHGLAAVLDDTASLWVVDDTPNNENRYRARFYLNPHSTPLATGAPYTLLRATQGSTALMEWQLTRSGTSYYGRVRTRSDDGTWRTGAWKPISNALHFVEVDWRAATAAGTNNGSLSWWLDGTPQNVLSAVDNDLQRVTSARLGVGIAAGTPVVSGTLYLDAFESRRTSYIGPVAPPVTSTTVLAFDYDPLYRLTDADYATGESWQYGYDAVGNRVALTDSLGVHSYLYDAANRLSSVDGVSYSWDNNGNLLADGSATYTYDAANRLTGVVAGGTTSAYTYDGLGNRTAQSVNGTLTRYTLDVAGGLPEVIAATTGANTTRYLQMQGQVLAQDTAGVWSYVLPDHLGSVRQLTNAYSDVTRAQRYAPFGEPLWNVGAGSSTFGFTGEQTDATGLLFLRARYYAPEVGQFTARDPLQGLPQHPYSSHPYQYTYSNPVRYIDQSGKCIPVLVLIDGPLPIGDVVTLVTCASVLVGLISHEASSLSLEEGTYAFSLNPETSSAFIPDPSSSRPSELETLVTAPWLHHPSQPFLIDAVPDTTSLPQSFTTPPWAPPTPWLTRTGTEGVPLSGVLELGENICRVEDGQDIYLGLPSPYGHLSDPANVAPGKDFSSTQKNRILEENRRRNGGVIRSDLSGQILTPPIWLSRDLPRDQRTPAPTEWAIDHIVPKQMGGTNSYSNGWVLSRRENNQKKDKDPEQFIREYYDRLP